MNHVALDGTRSDNRYLNDQIVEFARTETRQHAHLRPTLNLEDADRVGATDHVIDRYTIGIFAATKIGELFLHVVM